LIIYEGKSIVKLKDYLGGDYRMTSEEILVQDLSKEFRFLEDKCNIARARRIFVDVPAEKLLDVLSFSQKSLQLTMLLTITGLDIDDNYQVIYHLATEKGIILNLKVNIPKSSPVIKTVTGVYQGATLYERELKDMFGIIVEGLAEGRRYPLPDEWPEGQHPLRKDWKPDAMKGVLENE